MSQRFIILFSYCIVVIPTLAQTGYGYHIQQFTTENGMPSNGIKGMEWDEKTGFLWVATEAGMTRFNGVDFTNFTKENTPGLSHERMALMVKNDSGAIYTVDGNGRIFIVKDNLIQQQIFPQKIKDGAGFKLRVLPVASGIDLQNKVAAVLNDIPQAVYIRVLKNSDTSIIIIHPNRDPYYISIQDPGFRQVPLPGSFADEFMIDG